MASDSERGQQRLSGLVCWALFEWARNPYILIITVYIYATYFTRDIVGDPVRGQALWASIQGYAGIGIAVLAPFLGAIADAGGRRKPWIAFFAILLALSTAALWFGKPGGAGIGFTGVAIAVAVSNIAYDGSLVFHAAMLPWVAPERRIGRWSGIAYALGNLAGIVLLIGILTFFYLPQHPSLGLDRATHEPERVSGPLCALWFIAFAWPFFVWTPDRKGNQLPFLQTVRQGLVSVAETFRRVRQHRDVAIFLAARMFYNDGLNVMLAFGGIYAAGVFHWGAVESAVYGIILSVFAALGGWLGGNLSDHIGTRRALRLSLLVMIVAAVVSLGFAPNRLFFFIAYPAGKPVTALPLFRTAPELFYIATVMVIAVCLVATYANSRAMLARIAPQSRMTEFFGLFALSGEATAFLAPLAVAFATSISGSQQWGMAAIVGFLAAGLIGLGFVREAANAGSGARR
jgi:MFS transporter, UMF1 family